MSDLPKFVHFHEEGPREGFQIEKQLYSVQDRVDLINALSASGLSQVQVGSFVSAKAVPTMADIDEVFKGIKKRDGVRYTALWLNETGFRKAQSTPQVDISAYLMFYTTDALSLRNNNCTAREMQERQEKWIGLYQDANAPIESAYIVTAFGCNLQGEVPISDTVAAAKHIIALALEHKIPTPRIFLADTVGWADPEEVKRRIGAVRDLDSEVQIGLHLHDTRGMGAANVYAALQMGVDMFDSSIAGLGGCPFAAHANVQGAGNVCTEDMVHMCHEMGIETGIDLNALLEAATVAERVFRRPLAGKLMHAGLPNRKGSATAAGCG
ncbi:hydroxymethylglutaryl-CoA lyase [Rhodoferax sp.]|uniref:hydroxymethylglutaryl-CoA lyase n=1 Tax=Rhodoferax sp. TaxID=50421 RepID=UPI002611E7E2|nr:hydroxymethylglutaryl-CoA lyase [Rhodoferax sp.]MDD2919650.1 hydroxymethylglutaryl-CoA lyase [Rhodoferax sp.]